MKLAILLSILVLTGCATFEPMAWHRPDTTEAQFHADLAAARAETIRLAPLPVAPPPAPTYSPGGYQTQNFAGGFEVAAQRSAENQRRDQYFRALMESKGYRLVPKTKTPTPGPQ